MAPPSQKADVRPIGFYLTSPKLSAPRRVTMVVRPEDLSYNRPSLMTPQNTLGGAFIDDFGEGFGTIQISGTTGWNLNGGWLKNFQDLQSIVFDDWHAQRALCVADGIDPDGVKIIFADALDDITRNVAPQTFGIKRSKSRPLLMSYQISLLTFSDTVDQATLDKLTLNPDGTLKVSGGGPSIPGIASLSDSINKLVAYEKKLNTFIDNSIVGPARSFMQKTNSVLTQTLSSIRAITGPIDQQAQVLIGLAADMAQTGRNIFVTYNAIMTLPQSIQHEVSGVASAYENAFCVLKNAFKTAKYYPDYSSVYGASNCSSTIGGSPLSAYGSVNTFEAISTIPSVATSVSSEAFAAMSSINTSDPVLNPKDLDSLSTAFTSIANGVVL